MSSQSNTQETTKEVDVSEIPPILRGIASKLEEIGLTNEKLRTFSICICKDREDEKATVTLTRSLSYDEWRATVSAMENSFQATKDDQADRDPPGIFG